MHQLVGIVFKAYNRLLFKIVLIMIPRLLLRNFCASVHVKKKENAPTTEAKQSMTKMFKKILKNFTEVHQTALSLEICKSMESEIEEFEELISHKIHNLILEKNFKYEKDIKNNMYLTKRLTNYNLLVRFKRLNPRMDFGLRGFHDDMQMEQELPAVSRDFRDTGGEIHHEDTLEWEGTEP